MRIPLIFCNCLLLLTACSHEPYPYPTTHKDPRPQEYTEMRRKIDRNEQAEVDHQLNNKNLSKKERAKYASRRSSMRTSVGRF